MTALNPLMNLGVQVGGIQLSQSLPCRPKSNTPALSVSRWRTTP
jgi:hypothetical protein